MGLLLTVSFGHCGALVGFHVRVVRLRYWAIGGPFGAGAL